jgi:ABC-type multidrug transport system fused ATPase/permease subunit
MANDKGNVILSFDKVNFSYNEGKNIILKDASFSVRENTKITIM